MENWQGFITAHEPIIGAFAIVWALWAVNSRLDVIANQLSITNRVLTSTEIGQERVEQRLSEVVHQQKELR
jgi:hypothetical protein